MIFFSPPALATDCPYVCLSLSLPLSIYISLSLSLSFSFSVPPPSLFSLLMWKQSNQQHLKAHKDDMQDSLR